jgi:transposase-like protein
MNLNDPIFSDETKARAYFENLRWPNGVVCVHCGGVDRVYRLEGKSHRPGLFHCNDCDGSFTVTTGGVMESSHIPLTKWALGFRLMASSKKGVSAHQLHRSLGITYKSAWFMGMRIREAMGIPKDAPKLGGPEKIVESDETEISPSKKTRKPKHRRNNKKFLALIERGGNVRSLRIDDTKIATLKPIIDAHVEKSSRFMTDTAAQYVKGKMGFEQHEMVNHSKDEYVRGAAHVNTAEGYFSLFKRGLVGTYQHMSERHLPRYLAEFDFRMSNRIALGVNDEVRTERAIKGAEGKRLRYQGTYQP